MKEILTLNKIAACGTDQFDPARYTVGDTVGAPEGVLVRSAAMHDMELPESLCAIARAGAGVNNIPVERCSEQGIVVFNTPGANANAVKELVLCGLLLASRKIAPALSWVQTLKGEGAAVPKLVEKGKSAFAGPEIKGKKLGVIGLGAIGGLVANAARSLGMEVYGFDPYLSVDAAWALSSGIHHATDFDQIYQNCDYISIHVPLTDSTRGFIGEKALSGMKDGVRILNFARAELVDSEAMKAALSSGKVAAYVVDFPTEEMLGVENVVALPHLGASTPESEDNCAVMAVREIVDYIENGNIRNSVNLPNVEMAISGNAKICVIHKNAEGLLNNITAPVSAAGLNIENMVSKSKKDYAYTCLDVKGDASGIEAAIKAVSGVVSVRVIK